MEKATVNEIKVYTETADSFGGLNENTRISENEFRDMKNMSSDGYPALTVRKSRGVYIGSAMNTSQYNQMYYPVTGRMYEYRLAVVEDNGENIVIQDYSTSEQVSAVHYIVGYDSHSASAGGSSYPVRVKDYTCTAWDWRSKNTSAIQMGSYTLLHNRSTGDLLYFNGRKGVTNVGGDLYYTESGTAGKSTTITGIEVNVCYADGTEYGSTITASAVPPSYPTYSYWLNTSTNPSTLYRYDTASATWVESTDKYIKIEATGIGNSCEVGDTPSITMSIGTSIGLHDVGAVRAKGTNYIVADGWMNYVNRTEVGASVTVAKTVPKMDYVVESGNRLWGCRYGLNRNNEFVNEIYASKLGDFKSWTVYEGISTDSYTASVGSEGAFTGAIEYLGHPVFFKENYIHRIYGTEPSNFQVQTLPCEGVAEGAGNTLCLCDNLLYYLSKDNVCAYDGSRPYHMGDSIAESIRKVREMPNKQYLVLNAGTWKRKYYLYMNTDGTQNYELTAGTFYVYDTGNGLWHKEKEETEYTAEIMASLSDGLYCSKGTIARYPDTADGWWIKPSSGGSKISISANYVWSIEGTYEAKVEGNSSPYTYYGYDNAKCEHKIEWSAETCEIGLSDPNKRTLSKLVTKVHVGTGCVLRMWVQYDGVGEWILVRTLTGTDLIRTGAVTLRPRRCGHFRIKFSGEGEDVTVYSVTKYYEENEI